MRYINKHFAVFTLLLAFASGCTLNNKVAIDQTPAIHPIYTPIYTSVNTTPQVFENIVYDKNYLKDCKAKYPPIYNQQVGYRGAYPGITTIAEAVERFGPSDTHSEADNGEKLYSYSNSFNFSTRDQIVENIYVVADSEVILPLKNIFEKYGCPDLIMAEARSDDSFNESPVYNHTFLMYSNAGVWINFNIYPIKYSSNPYSIVFTKPTKVDDFLEERFSSPIGKFSILVSFSEAVVDK